jgi:hypothetical protein
METKYYKNILKTQVQHHNKKMMALINYLQLLKVK